jgi:hypothetical protein
VEIISDADGTYSIRQTDTGLIAIRQLELEEANAIVSLVNQAQARRKLKEALVREAAVEALKPEPSGQG